MTSKYKVYCVSGVESVDRRLNVLHSAKKMGWTLEFFPAVYPPKNFDQFLVFREILKYGFNEGLLPGEVGCALSHLILWERLVRSEFDFFVVFEDDVSFLRPPSALKLFADVDFQMLNDRSNPMPDSLWLGPKSCGSDGYVVHKSGAKKFLDNFKHVDTPIDIMILKGSLLFGGVLRVAVSEPIVAHDDTFSSEIGGSRIVFSGRAV
jgi:GR25 family glycosyltransferase involved in LPS biosynthesis